MPDPAQRFIDTATTPLADNPELQIAARQELAGLIENAHPGHTDSLDTAAERLEEKRSGKWRYVVYAVTGIISAVILATSATSILKFREGARELGLINGPLAGDSTGSVEKELSRNLTPQQKLLLLGDTRRSGKVERLKALWESDPENPAYYADYVAAYLSQHQKLPADLLDKATKLDPDNAWFRIMAASVLAKNATNTSSYAKVTTPGGAKIRPIVNAAMLDEAIATLHSAAELPHFSNYQLTLVKQRVPLLPKRTDSLNQMPAMAYMAGLTAPNLQIRNLAEAVAAKAIEQAKTKDVAGFQQMLADWEAFTNTHIHSRAYSLVDVLVALSSTQIPLKALSEAAGDLGLPDDATRLKAMDDRFEAWKAMTRAHPNPNADIGLHSSMIAGMSLPVVSKQSSRAPAIPPEDLKPGRLADHALAGRAMSILAWTVLGLATLAAGLYRFRCGVLARRLSEQFVQLLRPVDWLWIMGVGILLPMIYFVVISRFTPLDGREWSIKASKCVVPAGQFSSMLYLMIVLPLIMIRRRLALRGGAAGLAGGKQWFARVAVISGVLALPMFGLTFDVSQPQESVVIGAGSLLALIQLYTLVAGSRAIFSHQSSLLRRATISRLLLPVYALGMLAMIIGMLLFHAEEKHWIAQDRLMVITEEAPGLTPFEYDLTQTMQQELIELVKGAP